MIRTLICLSLVVSCSLCLSASVGAEDAGQADLDKATELQLDAKTLTDIEKVIALCESAIEKGLDESSEQFARQLLVASLWDHASRVAQSIAGRRPDNRQWRASRELALSDLNKLLEVDEKFGDAYLLRAKLQTLPNGSAEKALEDVTRAIDVFQDDNKKRAEALVLRVRLQQDEEKQLADLNAAIEADGENSNAWLLRAAYYAARDQLDKSVEDLQQVLTQQPENVTVLLALTNALKELGMFDKAKSAVDQAIELAPNDANNYFIRAQVRLAEENADEVLADLNKSLELAPDSPLVLLMRARLHLLREALPEARGDVDRVAQLAERIRDPRVKNQVMAEAVLLRSLVSGAQGRFQEAIQDLQLLLRNNPANVELRLQISSYLVADQRPRKAIELLTNLINQDEGNWMALRSRGDALLSVGKHADAIEDYTTALELQPDNDGILNNLAWVLATSPKDKLRDGNRAVELATKACEVTNFEQPHILSTLAAGYAEKGDFEAAIKWSEKAVELGKETLREQIEQLEQELESYRRQEPWRELQNIEEKPDPPRNVIEA